MTKKNILSISLTYVVYLIFLLSVTWNCKSDWCDIQEDGLYGIILFCFSPLFPVFIFSLITYKMKDEVFEVWRNFSYWWIPLSVLLVLITPEGNSVIMSWGKEIPAVGMTILYVAICIGIILGKSFKLRMLPTSAIILCLVVLVLVATYAYRILT